MLQKNGKETCRGAQQLAELASIGDMEIPLFQKRNENREATTATTTINKKKRKRKQKKLFLNAIIASQRTLLRVRQDILTTPSPIKSVVM